MAAKTLTYFLETGNISNSVNFPTVDLAFNSPLRLAIVNRNITNMIGQMSVQLAENNINIVNIINRGRGAYAYTLIDIEDLANEPLEKIIKDIKNVEGILTVRSIRNKNKK